MVICIQNLVIMMRFVNNYRYSSSIINMRPMIIIEFMLDTIKHSILIFIRFLELCAKKVFIEHNRHNLNLFLVAQYQVFIWLMTLCFSFYFLLFHALFLQLLFLMSGQKPFRVMCLSENIVCRGKLDVRHLDYYL